jgi:hypothetical protein
MSAVDQRQTSLGHRPGTFLDQKYVESICG